MNVEQEIRVQIEKNKGLKLAVGEINNHLSVLEGLLRSERDDVQKRVDEAYQKGLDDAWEAAKKLFSSMTDSDIEKAFPIEWNNGGFKALMDLKPQEAIAKLKAYEEKQAKDDIKVGDVVTNKCYNQHNFVVTKVSDESVWGVDANGSWNYWAIDDVTKTDKHFDIENILEEIRG